MKPFLREFLDLPLYLKGARTLSNGGSELTLFVEAVINPQQVTDTDAPRLTAVTFKSPVEFTVEVSASVMDRLQKPEPHNVEFKSSREQWEADKQAAIEAYYRERREIFTALAGVVIDAYRRKQSG